MGVRAPREFRKVEIVIGLRAFETMPLPESVIVLGIAGDHRLTWWRRRIAE
jgi:hypothetical protein